MAAKAAKAKPETETQPPKVEPAKIEIKNVHDGVIHVMSQCPYVLKTGKMKFGDKYSYVSEADLIRAVHDKMIEAGLTLIPTDAAVVHDGQYPSGQEKIMHRLAIKMTYTLTHAASGTSTPVVVIGAGCDLGDKGPAKAMTIAYKYALKQAFCIETGDDPDRVNSQELAEVPQQEAPPKKAADWAAFDGAMAAVRKAPDLDILQKYKNSYDKRGFAQAQLVELDREFNKRAADLKKSLPAAQSSPDDGPGF